MKSLSRIPKWAVLSLMLLVLFAAVGTASAAPAEQGPIGTIGNVSLLNVRSGPGVGHGIITRVSAGAVVTLLSRNADASWVEVALAGGVRGWVNSRYVLTSFPINSLPTSIPVTVNNAVVTAWHLNVRSGPSAGFGVVGQLGRGEIITLIGRVFDNTWVQIVMPNGVQGWVNSRYITPNVLLTSLPITGDASGVPTAPPPPNASPTGVVTAWRLNVRSAPGLWGRIVASTSQGQSVSLLGRNSFGNWLFVQVHGGFTGWVNANYVLTGYPIGNLPIAG